MRFARSLLPTSAVSYASHRELDRARHDVGHREGSQDASHTLLVVTPSPASGHHPPDVDTWGHRPSSSASPKSPMIPPGLAYCAVSDRACSGNGDDKAPRYYFDLRREKESPQPKPRPPTRPRSMFAALAAALDTSARWEAETSSRKKSSNRKRRTLRRHDPRRSASPRTKTICAKFPAPRNRVVAPAEADQAKSASAFAIIRRSMSQRPSRK